MSFAGFVNAGLQLGLQSITVSPYRGILAPTAPDGTVLDDIHAQATVEEHHRDELEITEHPVEQGAAISDHAFKRPAEVTLVLGWSNSPSSDGSLINSAIGFATASSAALRNVADAYETVSGVLGIQSELSGAGVSQIQSIYQKLLDLQEKRALFVLYTGKRVYTNMVCKMLTTETDYKSAHSMLIRMVCKQVILVNTSTTSLTSDTQKSPEDTTSPTDNGAVNLQRT